MRRIGSESLHQSIANMIQIVFGRDAIEMVEHVTFGSDRGTLDLHSGATGNEEKDFVRTFEVFRQPHGSVVNVG